MNFNNRQLKNSTITMRVVCAIVFCLFSFLFLYCFQAAVMAAAQHVQSEGKTHYSPIVGAVIITFILQLLQIGIFSITKLKKRSHALTYFPSCLLLAFVTDISPNIDQGFSIGAWVWVFPLLIIIYVIIVLFACSVVFTLVIQAVHYLHISYQKLSKIRFVIRLQSLHLSLVLSV